MTVTDLVRSLTGGFTEQSMKANPAVRTPRDNRRPGDDQRPISRRTLI
jgi:hypothetical protein